MCLLKSSFSRSDLDMAEQELIKFVAEYNKLYEHENVTMNVHLLVHVPT